MTTPHDSYLARLLAFQELSMRALTAKSVDELLARAAEALESAFQAALARIWLAQPDGTLLMKASAGLSRKVKESSRYIIDPANYPYKVGRVALSREPFLSNNISECEEFDREWTAREQLVSVAVLPLLNDEHLEGVLALFSRRPIDEFEQKSIETFAAHITVALRQTLLREELLCHERLAGLGQLAGAVAHDLRLPLSRITSAAELLAEMDTSNEEQRTYINYITRSAEEMNEIIGSLLDYARPVALGCSHCDVGVVVEGAVKELSIPDNVTVSTEFSAISDAVLINPVQMKRVFVNLIKNAVEAMPSGGTIKIAGSQNETHISISITDTGCGIERENLHKIFSPLFTKTVTGTGFGLAVSRSIVEAHGGKIHVTSETNVGSTFVVTIPLSTIKP